MSASRPAPAKRLLWLAALVVLIALASGPLMSGLVAGRLRSAAAERGLVASWSSLRVGFPARAEFRGLVLTRRDRGDTTFRAESLAVSLDPWALLVLHPRVAGATVAHARFIRRHRPAVDPDTLAPEPDPRARAGDPQRAERFRDAARGLIRVLAAPARSLPRLALHDVSLIAAAADGAAPGDEEDGSESGLHLDHLLLTPAAGGITLAAAGNLFTAQPMPFTATLEYGRDDRIVGAARFLIAYPALARPESLLVRIDGALQQDRRGGRVTIADRTRLDVGTLGFRLAGSLERSGPAFRLALDADSLTASQFHSSLPRAMLGPLADLSVRGWFADHVRLALDLSRPDDVDLAADVVPHGLEIDPARTRLDLAGLDEPFVAHIHLPRGRIVDRDLSPANPHFRPLEGIDTLLANAVLTNEDGAFFRHQGFNLEAVRGAITDDLKAGAFRRGAGTITMQLVRNLYLGHERTLSRKAQEVVLAWVLEHLTPVSKRRMLEIYLNIIEWGPDVHGADEACAYYLGHDAGHLTVDEALFLATVVPAPTKWRYRFDSAGALRPFEQAQMHFIGRAMIARGWLAPELLPPVERLHVELKGPAGQLFLPTPSAPADTSGT
jgi:hypothetical protein